VRKGLAAALQLDRAPVELWLDLPERTVFSAVFRQTCG
jgi:hypothetical protein